MIANEDRISTTTGSLSRSQQALPFAVSMLIAALCTLNAYSSNEITGSDINSKIGHANAIPVKVGEIINEHYSPVYTPCQNKVRGLALSGKGELLKIFKDGSIKVGNESLHWKCRFILTEGTTLITALGKPILVSAGDLNVFLDEGTTAVVHLDKELTRCANMTDHHKGSMKILFGKYFHDIAPGRETVFIKDNSRDPEELATREGIGWRDMSKSKVDGTTILTFKILNRDMLKKMNIYKQLQESPLEADHQLCQELLKSTAALESMYVKKMGSVVVSPPFKYSKPGARTGAESVAAATETAL